MPGSGRVAVGIGAIVVAALAALACSSSEHPGAYVSGTDPSATAGTGNASINVGKGNGNGGTNGTIDDACVGDVSTAQAVPLDMYVMLDVSTSMLDRTATTTSKWVAVKTALESFLNDKDSAGLGVGIQFFPIELSSVPKSCTSDAACGNAGPCFSKFCYRYYSIGGYVACSSDADCEGDDGSNFGPCTQLAHCSGDATWVCPNPGAACQSQTTQGLGTCTGDSGTCLNPDSCDATAYAKPAADIATLPDAAASIVASIDAQTPQGNTPTAPALTGAIQRASDWAKAHPDHRVITVLATDGIPTRCSPTDIDSVSQIARAGVTATPSINTFVIGVFGPDDVAANAPDNLNSIAQQGGTQAAFIVDTQQDVTTQFLKALDTIRGARLACQFQIPEPSAGSGSLEYDRVNVQFTNGSQQSDIFYVESVDQCDATTGGWYYDADPAKGGVPKTIIACPTTCTAFQSAASGASVGIALGCGTVVK